MSVPVTTAETIDRRGFISQLAGAATAIAAGGATLKLWEPGAEAPADGGLSADMTLTEFYWAYVRKICLAGKSRARNFEQYEESLKLWDLYTGGPALAKIDEHTCATFLEGLRARPTKKKDGTISENTVRKHAIAIQSVLDKAGPKNRKNRQGKSLLADPPYVEKPAVIIDEVDDYFRLKEIGWWLEACGNVKRPKGPTWTPRLWWESLTLTTYNTGLRIGTLLQLRWSWLEKNELGWWAKCPRGSLKKSRAQRVYVNAAALSAMHAIRGSSDVVFAWPYTVNYLQACRHAMLEQSELPATRRFGFHALRKGMSTELGKINKVAVGIIAAVLGHQQTRTVTVDCYLALETMAGALDQLPQPVWSRQKLLF